MGLREVHRAEGGGRTVAEGLARMGIQRLGNENSGGQVDVVDESWETGVQMGGHFELHIEQGPHLADAGDKVGVVEGVQADRWYDDEFYRTECLTGQGVLSIEPMLYWRLRGRLWR